MANTTWSSTDKTAVTLSGTNNLTATATGSGGVRTADWHNSGKYYFEYTCPNLGTSGHAIGIANASAVLISVYNTGANAAYVYNPGTIYINGSSSGSTLGSRANGDIIGIALDCSANLIWFRVAPSGNWNGSGTANPATGAGGLSVASIASSGLYGLFCASGPPLAATANFGDSAFTGAVPSGFTAGFPVTSSSAIYYGRDNSYVDTSLVSPPASGPVTCLIDMGPTFGKQWQYSGAVNGTTTFYFINSGPSLGRQRSAT
jgi:hypothetical protein